MKKLFYVVMSIMVIASAPGCYSGHYVSARPDAVIVSRPARPGNNYIWTDGNYYWRNGRYVYRNGYWAHPRAGRTWRSGVWQHGRRGYYWHRGGWH